MNPESPNHTQVDLLDVAVRPFVESLKPPMRSAKELDEQRVPETVLVIDAETTIDAAQRLRFLIYRYYRALVLGGRVWLSCVEEGIVYADDLAKTDPDDFALLREYARTRKAAVDPTVDVSDRLKFMPRREFVSGKRVDGKLKRGVFFNAVYKSRAWLVCFNLPFDVSRLAVGSAPARGSMFGGHSLILGERFDETTRRWVENRFAPRVQIKALDPKRALKRFSTPNDPDDIDQVTTVNLAGERGKRLFRGHFLDLRQLAFALTDEGHTLPSACNAFDVPYTKRHVEHGAPLVSEYVDYGREDVEATARLLEAAMGEYLRHPITLQATKAFSPASIGKAHLRTLGVIAPLTRQPEFARWILGAAMAAYYGGRTEARIRGIPIPVRHVDFLSMYPTVCALLGVWRLVSARRIATRDATKKAQRLLDSISVEDCLDPKTWRDFNCLVQLAPDGDLLPVRARYTRRPYNSAGAPSGVAKPSLGIGVNPLDTDGQPVWFTLADAVASKLLTGRPPRVLRAISFHPAGGQQKLSAIKLRGQLDYDPKDDLYMTLVEERQRLRNGPDAEQPEAERLQKFIKTLANSTSYGIFAETNPQELPKGKNERVRIHGLDDQPFELDVPRPESHGEFVFPPIAACITGGARLMLAILETLVSEAGGSHAYTDTDSMMIAATEHGGLADCPGGNRRLANGEDAIHALSWAEVERIRQRFRQLNPYDPELIPDLLKLEDTNLDPKTGQPRELYALAISAKRYALYSLDSQGEPIIVKASEHGLGHLLNPTDPNSDNRAWITTLWQVIVRQRLGLAVELPAWLDEPAITRVGAGTPAMLDALRSLNERKPYARQVKPFNFLLSCQVARGQHPAGVQPERFHLILPFTSDPKKSRRAAWHDLHGSGAWHITTTGITATDDRVIRVKTIRDVLREHTHHPELKSLDPDGHTCTSTTVGLLSRRPVHTTRYRISYIGKESNRLDDLEAGLIHDESDVLTVYRSPAVEREEWFTEWVPRLRAVGTPKLAVVTQTSERALRDTLAGRAYPHAHNRRRLIEAIDEPDGEEEIHNGPHRR